MKVFGWLVGLGLIVCVTALALDMVNGGQLLEWLNANTGPRDSASRF